MKILLLLFLLIGCAPSRDLKPLEDYLYNTDIIYVDVDKSVLHTHLNISNNDYKDIIALKTLVSYQREYILIFQQPSTYLIMQLKAQINEHYQIYESNSCILIISKENSLFNDIKQVLNKINES